MTGRVSEIRQNVTDKKDDFVSSAQEATPESASDAGQRVKAFIGAERGGGRRGQRVRVGMARQKPHEPMSLIFKPIGILSGLAAGMLGKKIFELLWGLIDDQDPPEPKYRRVRLGKLAAALLLEGAIFRLIRGFAEHGARHGFSALSGEWPGDESPQPKDGS